MKRIVKIFLMSVLLSFSIIATGCTSNTDDPLDALKEQYGSTEFQISFYSELLETPLSDMVYTALNMPILPTPSKTGYIFLGWYMDKDYTTPYYDNVLYLYMKDVTLYAKWQKEEFVSDGIYDIEISSEIINGSVVKGELTDEYGGYLDISNYFIEEECYIEKSGDDLQLRLQYDNLVTIPFSESLFTFNLSVDGRMGGEISVDSSITALSEPIHTQYIDINNFDVSNEMYFNIVYKNYTSGLSTSDSAKTQTSYTIKIVIDRIIGFSKNYQDNELVLEDGYYQTRTTYKQTNLSDTMGQQFNPEFSYIIAEKGNYTLVKPFYPYAGLTSGTTNMDIKDVYFERMAAFSNSLLYYSVPSSSVDFDADPTEDFYPATVNALKYGTFILEYNQETGLFYMIMDMGNSLDNYFVIPSAITGYMEVAGGMGHVDMLMIPDYEHIIKVNEINYTPIEETNPFTYSEEFVYYPGSASDFNDNTIYDVTKEYGISTDFYNFMYTDDNSSGIKSFRLTSTPSVTTSSSNVSEQKGQVAYYNRKVEVYGVNIKEESLNVDKMSSQTFGYTGLRNSEEIRVGMGVELNSQLNMDTLIKKFISSNLSVNNCIFTAYPISNGVIDYSKTIPGISNNFYVTQSMAILVEFGDCYSLIELMQIDEPIISIDNTAENTYTENKRYSNGDSILYPRVEYSYMGNEDSFWGEYYSSESGVRSVDMIVFSYDQGIYGYTTQPGYESTSFIINTAEIYVIYEITNIYGEVYQYKLLFSSYSSAFYDIKDNNGNYIVKDSEYKLSSTTGNYTSATQSISYTFESLEQIINASFSIQTRYHKEHYFPTDDVMEKTTITIKSNSMAYSFSNITTVEALNSIYESYGYSSESYVLFTVKYYCNDVTLSVNYIKDVSFNGQDSPYLLDEDTYFINNSYEVLKPQMIDSNSSLMDLGTITFEKIDGSKTTSQYLCISYGWIEITENKYDYEFKFLLQGTWKITYDYKTISYTQIIDVKSDSIEVVITYVLTDGYKFADGTTSMDVSYSLNSTIITLGIGTTSAPTFANYSISNNIFSIDNARLLGWSTTANQRFPSVSGTIFGANSAISDFVSEFGSLSTTLYIVVDPGLNLQITYKYTNASNTVLFNVVENFMYYTTSTTLSSYYCSLSNYGNSTSSTSVNNILNGKVDIYGYNILSNYTFIEFTNYSGTTLNNIYTTSNNAYVYAKFGVELKVNYNVNGVNDQYAYMVDNSKTFISLSTNILEGTSVTSLSSTIESKYNIIMNAAYSDYIIDYYVYYNGSGWSKFDLTSTSITIKLDSNDGDIDYTVQVYAVYVKSLTIKYNTTGYNDEYNGYTNSVITDSTNVRANSRVAQHMFSTSETLYVNGKNTITLTSDYSSYTFIGWSYYNGTTLVLIDLLTTNITQIMADDNNIVNLYAVYAKSVKAEFSDNGISLSTTGYYGYTFASQISNSDLTLLSNYETNNNIYWAYYNGTTYIKIDLYTTILTEEMAVDSVISLVAISK